MRTVVWASSMSLGLMAVRQLTLTHSAMARTPQSPERCLPHPARAVRRASLGSRGQVCSWDGPPMLNEIGTRTPLWNMQQRQVVQRPLIVRTIDSTPGTRGRPARPQRRFEARRQQADAPRFVILSRIRVANQPPAPAIRLWRTPGDRDVCWFEINRVQWRSHSGEQPANA
jgi:hypothetical protein